jgi:hypothetical protein
MLSPTDLLNLLLQICSLLQPDHQAVREVLRIRIHCGVFIEHGIVDSTSAAAAQRHFIHNFI